MVNRDEFVAMSFAIFVGEEEVKRVGEVDGGGAEIRNLEVELGKLEENFKLAIISTKKPKKSPKMFIKSLQKCS